MRGLAGCACVRRRRKRRRRRSNITSPRCYLPTTFIASRPFPPLPLFTSRSFVALLPFSSPFPVCQKSVSLTSPFPLPPLQTREGSSSVKEKRRRRRLQGVSERLRGRNGNCVLLLLATAVHVVGQKCSNASWDQITKYSDTAVWD